MSSHDVSVDATHPPLGTKVATGLFVLLGTSYALNAMDRQVFSVLLPHIRNDYSFELSTGGLLSTIFGLGVGVGALVAGFLADRYTRKRVIIAGIAVYSAFTFTVPLAAGFVDMAVYRTISGLGEGLQQAALYAAIGSYYSARRATALGALNFGFGSGTVFGPVLGGAMYAASGSWELPFFIFGASGMLFIFLVAAVVPLRYTERISADDRSGAPDNWRSQAGQLLNRDTAAVLMTSVTVGLAAFGWIAIYPTYAREVLGLSTVQGSYIVAAFGVGALLMGFVGGALGDRLDARSIVAASLLGSGVCAWLLFEILNDAWTIYLTAGGLGALSSGFAFVNLYAMAQRSVPAVMTGRISGIFVFVFYTSVAVSGYTIGTLVDLGGWSFAMYLQLAAVPTCGAALIFAARSNTSAGSVT